MRLIVASVITVCATATGASACPTFQVSFDETVRAEPVTGRLVVYLIPDTARMSRVDPADGPFFQAPQPMFGIDVEGLAPGQAVALGEQHGVAYPGSVCDLAPGGYRVQAVLDMARDNSSWAGEPGNLYSAVQRVDIPGADDSAYPDFTIDIQLSNVVPDRTAQAFAETDGAELVEVRSALLSTFHGRDVTLRAGVVYPDAYDETKQYPAFYVVPGFGGDHTIALGDVRRRGYRQTPERALFDANIFVIILDPESGNGHHLFANSACNGPVGDALVQELVPEITRRFNLIDAREARIVRGHSSGGWSALWLALNYPETFGHAFASAPDPVDFRAFQAINIYEDANAYMTGEAPVPSYRTQSILGDDVKMTVAQENAMEEVLGPDNASGQQWDSWFAVFGLCDDAGNPKALWDAKTGAIDPAVAQQFASHDIGRLVREDPERYGPIFRDRVHLVIGAKDSFYLERAVRLLLTDLRELGYAPGPEDQGAIEIVPDANHYTVLQSAEVRGTIGRMLDLLRAHGYLVRSTSPPLERDQ